VNQRVDHVLSEYSLEKGNFLPEKLNYFEDTKWFEVKSAFVVEAKCVHCDNRFGLNAIADQDSGREN
jgi:hypothetical protein